MAFSMIVARSRGNRESTFFGAGGVEVVTALMTRPGEDFWNAGLNVAISYNVSPKQYVSLRQS